MTQQPTTGHIPWENHNSKDTCTPMFTTAIFTIARIWKQPKYPSTEEWIKMWYIYNGILLSHKKERNWVMCRDVDGPRDCHTEWIKSEKQISYVNAYMWNLEKWYRWTYLQSRNRDTDIEKKHMDTKGGREVGGIGRLGLTYIHYYL